MSDPFVAEIRMFGGDFAPNGWARCNGQLMLISQNAALFSRLGTLYGGDGKTTFALPRLEAPARDDLSPALAVKFFIAMRGIFPSRGSRP